MPLGDDGTLTATIARLVAQVDHQKDDMAFIKTQTALIPSLVSDTAQLRRDMDRLTTRVPEPGVNLSIGQFLVLLAVGIVVAAALFALVYAGGRLGA